MKYNPIVRKRARRGGLGGLFSFKVETPFMKAPSRKPPLPKALIKAPPRKVAPVENLPSPIVMDPPKGPFLMYEVYQKGPGYSDHRMFGFQKTSGGWKSYGAWKAEGEGEPPLPLKIAVQSPSAMNSIFNRCLGFGEDALSSVTEFFNGPLVPRSKGPADFLLGFMDDLMGDVLGEDEP